MERALGRIRMTGGEKGETCVSRRSNSTCRQQEWGVLARRLLVLAALIFAVSLALGGCGGIFAWPFSAGTYFGDLPCTMDVVDPFGSAAQDEFTSEVTLTVDAEGRFSLNGVELVVGAEVIRSTPTADLAFEVTKVTRQWHVLTVEYAPGPTLVGITVDGELVETYRWHAGSVLAAAQADLLVTDVTGTATFTVDCEGALTAL
jgi:hypothetical protein